ncbi:MAG: 16S rRNA (guanine(527)-N(7))-methyltransferase RsmG [Filifactoraceae bacterium]
MEEKLNQILEEGLKQWDISISPIQLQQFKSYKDILLEYNKMVNLTAIEDEEEVYKKHFLDSISPLAVLDIPKNAKVIDVGTGAGFPSLPLKIMRNDIELSLLDSLNKRVNFLKLVGEKLNLDKISYIHARAEEGARKKELREGFDICVSRAVANLSTLLEYCTPYIKVGGRLICLKGPMVFEEVEKAERALNLLGCEIQEIIDVDIPYTELNHKIVVIKKVKSTPKTYPRKSGSPSKSPL